MNAKDIIADAIRYNDEVAAEPLPGLVLFALLAQTPDGVGVHITPDGTLGWLEACGVVNGESPHRASGVCESCGCDPLYVVREVEG